MKKNNKKVLSDRDREILMKNRGICTDSSGMHCFDRIRSEPQKSNKDK